MNVVNDSIEIFTTYKVTILCPLEKLKVEHLSCKLIITMPQVKWIHHPRQRNIPLVVLPTHHITPNAIVLQHSAPYSGPDQPHLGNSQGMPIVATGYSSLRTHQRPLHLYNILHVPKIMKNLCSV